MKDEKQGKQGQSSLTSFADKHAYCEQVKMENFAQSMRLEGYEIEVPSLVENARKRDELRQQLIRHYKQADTEKV
ncbi:YhfG family protein [Photobacterium leiognathi]|uniref:YhfG family protein n=1 Tax=Photobacterium leiognathi TaxID=553611 RepID=UPI002732DB57|nr:YhfG family protein [Photobacterium leiognathi]